MSLGRLHLLESAHAALIAALLSLAAPALAACGDDGVTSDADTGFADGEDLRDDTTRPDLVDVVEVVDADDAQDAVDAVENDALDIVDVTLGDTEILENDVAPDTSLDTDTAPDVPTTPPVWDLPAIRDAATADCTWGAPRLVIDDGVSLEVRAASYLSWESIDGALVPIRIRGYLARPAATPGRIPGIVLSHGLGGFAVENQATSLAALTGATVLAYTGPGGGDAPDNTSEGRASGYDDGLRMFDTLPDVRGSWFWGHAVAAMRGLTCLAARADVDPSRLGMTGYSAGAVATLTVSGVDDRVLAAVPLSGTLAWDVATRSPSAWQHTLLARAGLDITSARWNALMDLLEPSRLLSDTPTRVFMVNGTTDEFFPVSAHVATYAALPDTRRTSFAGNFDHGCYALSGIESPSTIEDRADLRARGAQRAWFGHHFGTDPRFAVLPRAPSVALDAVGSALLVDATVDEPSGMSVVEVKLWWTLDDALVWGSNTLERQADGRYAALLPLTWTPELIAFVDVEYRAGVLGPRFAMSSTPAIPTGHIPVIRQIDSCLPP